MEVCRTGKKAIHNGGTKAPLSSIVAPRTNYSSLWVEITNGSSGSANYRTSSECPL